MTYEAPAIIERAAVGGPLIGTDPGSVLPPSPAWRRADDEQGEQA